MYASLLTSAATLKKGLVEGCILLVHGLRLSLPPFPFYDDTAACFVGGGAILYLSKFARPEEKKPD